MYLIGRLGFNWCLWALPRINWSREGEDWRGWSWKINMIISQSSTWKPLPSCFHWQDQLWFGPIVCLGHVEGLTRTHPAFGGMGRGLGRPLRGQFWDPQTELQCSTRQTLCTHCVQLHLFRGLSNPNIPQWRIWAVGELPAFLRPAQRICPLERLLPDGPYAWAHHHPGPAPWLTRWLFLFPILYILWNLELRHI